MLFATLPNVRMVAQIDSWPPAMQWFFAAWITFLGACFGSFMNVVVYRLPRGLSLVHPASRCPKCGHPIRPIDNVPVVSWLLLRGRCRDCRVRISARYPLVEAGVALLFLVVALVELQDNGPNLPATAHPPANIQRALWCNFAAQMLLLCTLVCALLIEVDGLRTPAVAYLPVLSVAVLLSCTVRGVPPILATTDPVQVSPWLAGLAGLAAGGGLGLLMLPARGPVAGGTMASVLGPACCGAVLGWQGVAAVATVAALLQLAAAIVLRLDGQRRLLSTSAGLLVAVLLLIVFWRLLAERWPRWLGEEASWPALISAAGAVLLASLATQSIMKLSGGPPRREKDRSS